MIVSQGLGCGSLAAQGYGGYMPLLGRAVISIVFIISYRVLIFRT